MNLVSLFIRILLFLFLYSSCNKVNYDKIYLIDNWYRIPDIYPTQGVTLEIPSRVEILAIGDSCAAQLPLSVAFSFPVYTEFGALNIYQSKEDAIISFNTNLTNNPHQDIMSGDILLFTKGSEYVFKDSITIKDYLIKSDTVYPLSFKLCDSCLIYLYGKGTISKVGSKTIGIGFEGFNEWVNFLNSPDTIKKEGSCVALSFVSKLDSEKQKAQELLIHCLGDNNCLSIRCKAAESIGKIGNVNSIPLLEKIINESKSNGFLKNICNQSIGLIKSRCAANELNGEESIDSLLVLLKNSYPAVRQEAANFLMKKPTLPLKYFNTFLQNYESEYDSKELKKAIIYHMFNLMLKFGDKSIVPVLKDFQSKNKDDYLKQHTELLINKLSLK